MKESWQLDPVFRQEFLDACQKAATNDEAFKNFRQNDRIATVIENTPMWWAEKAMELMGITPTMVRYQYAWFLLNELLHGWRSYKDRSALQLVEIGGGYGGQAEVIVPYEKCQYAIYDLPEVVELQQRYLLSKDIPVQWVTDMEYSFKADLLISWCAWSELNREMKQEYFDKVISKCKYIFICSNYNMEEDIEILSKGFDVNVYSDELVSGVLYGKSKGI